MGIRREVVRRGRSDALELRLDALGFPALFAVAIAVALVGQLVEDLVDDPTLQMLSPTAFSRPRWIAIALTVYMLLIVRRVDRIVERSVPAIQRVVRAEPERVEAYARQMGGLERRVDVAVFALSAAIVTLLFAVLRYPLPVTGHPVQPVRLFLPSGLPALPILAGYAVIGWAGIRLVLSTLRRARVLGRLTREPLAVDVFDPTDLLPFGSIALAISLGPAGVIVILLLGLGTPSGPLGWAVLVLASVAALLALLLPLRGVHGQMDRARDATLADLNGRLREIHGKVVASGSPEPAVVAQLNDRTSLLVQLRKVVSETTTWPFQDTVALARAVLVVSAPLIYTTLNELIKLYLLPAAR